MSLNRNFYLDTSSATRKENDYYPTPAIATWCLIKAEGREFPKKILEPCAGRGHISKMLDIAGKDVASRDLYQYDDPLVDIETGIDALDPIVYPEGYSAIVTNPPFIKKFPEKFIRNAFANPATDYLAIFSRMTFLESMGRYKLFSDHPPSRVHVFSDRINCAGEDFYDTSPWIGGMTNYAWFVWDKRFMSVGTSLKWILATDSMKLFRSDEMIAKGFR